MRAVAAAAVLALLSAPAGAFQESEKTAKMNLQGTWALKEVRTIGEESSKELTENMRGTKVIFSGDKMTMKMKKGGKDLAASYRIDPGKSPKEMDWIMETPDGGKRVMRGVYEQKGDQLTACFGGVSEKKGDKGDGGSKRPAGLTPRGDADLLFRFEREKP